MPEKLNYQNLWDNLISVLVRELVNIDRLGKKATVEDIWVKGTIIEVLKKMCALHRVPPKMQKSNLTRSLFE